MIGNVIRHNLAYVNGFTISVCWVNSLFYFTDTMVCTGCCATLDCIVTYLFKRLTKKQKKPHPNSVQDSDAFLRILELNPEILQQVSRPSTSVQFIFS